MTRLEKNVGWFFILVTPFIYFLFNREWLYPEVWSTDAYINHGYGYFYNLKGYQSNFYKVERTSWLVPLYYLKQLVGGYHLMIVWGMLAYLGLSSLYFLILRRLFNGRFLLLSVVLVATFPHLVSYVSGGGTYQNYAATLYFLAATLLWLIGLENTERKKTLFILVSGFFVGSTLISSLIHLNLLPLFLVLEYYKTKKVFYQNTLISLIGGGASFFIWSFLNFSLGRGWVSFSQRIDTLIHHTNPEHFYNSWYYGFYQLFFSEQVNALHLSFPMALFFINAFVIYFYRKHSLGETLKHNIFSVCACFYVLLWFGWHGIGMQSLYPSDFTYPLQVPLFLTLPALFNERVMGNLQVFLPKNDKWSLILASFTLWLLILSVSYFNGDFRYSPLLEDLHIEICLLVGLVFVFGFTWAHRSPNKISSIGAIISLLIFYCFFGDEYKSGANGRCLFKEEADHFVINMLEHLRGVKGDPRHIHFFHNAQEMIPIKRPHCHNMDLHVGATFHHISFLLGSRTFVGVGSTIFNEVNSLNLIDDEFFNRIYKKNGVLVLFSEFSQVYYRELSKFASKQGFSLELKEELHYDIVGNKLKGGVYTVRAI